MKNGKCHLLKIARARYIVILKGLGTSFQSAALSQKIVTNICHTAY